MNSEATQGHYLAVLCSRCKDRIPVPRRVAAIYGALKRGQEIADQATMSRAFTLRCKACHGESVYRIDEIQEFKGAPTIRRTKHEAAEA
jgi:hypothetical protein